jgi:methionine-rich copper-binding protein CopC
MRTLQVYPVAGGRGSRRAESEPGEDIMRHDRTTAIALAALIAISANGPAAFAHTRVYKTSIADNASIAVSPRSFAIEFEAKTAIASVSLTTAAGKAVPLTYTPPRDKAASFTIPLPVLSAGAYTLTWRAIGSDGHVMPGAVHFTITGG